MNKKLQKCGRGRHDLLFVVIAACVKMRAQFGDFRVWISILGIFFLTEVCFSGPVPSGKPLYYPDWWFERDVIQRAPSSVNNPTPSWPADYPQADDYAAVNTGQLKNVVEKAAAELNARLPNGAGSEINNLIASWSEPSAGRDDYAAINLGQLKAVASLFYARLIAESIVSRTPWGGPADNFAVVNIGQLKFVFCFNIQSDNTDSDADGLPDAWELLHGLSPSVDDAQLDSDGDGWSNLMEYLSGRNPKWDNRVENKRLVAGGDQSLWIGSSGRLFTWGRNDRWQLGMANPFNSNMMVATPTLLSNLLTTAAVFGPSHGLAITMDNKVYSWGDNYFGQLGDGTRVARITPSVISELTQIVQVAAGDYHSLVLRGDGTVWSWGGNQRGQLGDGTKQSRLAPVQVIGLEHVVEISAGADYSAALTSDGTVWLWGANDFGQLGVMDVVERTTPLALSNASLFEKISAGRRHVLALTRSGAVIAWGDHQAGELGVASSSGPLPQLIPALSNIKSISAGAAFSLALDRAGIVWSWGSNGSGKLGNGAVVFSSYPPTALELVNVDEISAGRDHVLMGRLDGTMMAWGLNRYYQLGFPQPHPYTSSPELFTVPEN